MADDDPMPRAEVMAYAAGLVGCRLTSAAAVGSARGERGRRRQREIKRVRNRRMRALLSPNGLAFPSYREGLDAIHASRHPVGRGVSGKGLSPSRARGYYFP